MQSPIPSHDTRYAAAAESPLKNIAGGNPTTGPCPNADRVQASVALAGASYPPKL